MLAGPAGRPQATDGMFTPLRTPPRGLGARPLPARRPFAPRAGRSEPPAAHQPPSSSDPPPSPSSTPSTAAALAAGALALATLAATARPASAWEHPHHGWKEGARPRRHTRPMGEADRFSGLAAALRNRRRRYEEEEGPATAAASKGVSPSSAAAVVDGALDAALDTAEAGVRGVAAKAASAAKAAARAVGLEAGAGTGGVRVGWRGRSSRGADSAAGPATTTLSARARPSPSSLVIPPSTAARLARPSRPLTDGELGAAAAVVALAALLFGRSRGWFGGRKGAGAGSGRWVRDRSLGGRMVWVEDGSPHPLSRAPRFDDGEDGGAAAGAPSSSYGPDFFDFDGAADASGAAAAAATRPAPASAAAAAALPPWWPPIAKDAPLQSRQPPPAGDPALAAAAAAGRAALAALTDAKAAGRDYGTPDMVALVLALSGTRLALAPPTPSIRDAIFRAGAGAAVDAVAGGGGVAVLGGLRPPQFVSSLAACLGVPPSAAANMALAAVAAKARALIVDAVAAARAEGGSAPATSPAVMADLAALASLLDALPFPAGAPQPPMIATAVLARARRDELVALGRAATGLEPGVAAQLAAVLGVGVDELTQQG